MEEDIKELKVESKWVVLAKGNSPKSFSHAAFIDNMRFAWSLAKEVSFKAIGGNHFVLSRGLEQGDGGGAVDLLREHCSYRGV